jgi:DNA-binding NarL/FixJ family response regulator
VVRTERSAIRLVIQSGRDGARRALIAHLSSQQDFVVVGHTTAVRALPALCSLYHPDAAMLDTDVLNPPLVDAAARLRASFPTTEVIVRYREAPAAVLVAADNAGLCTVPESARGLDGLASLIRQATAADERNGTSRRSLTDRELAIVALMGAGRSVPEMAELLRISPHTVENHKRSIYAKFGVGNQSHAVSRAISLGLFDVSDVVAGGDGLEGPPVLMEPVPSVLTEAVPARRGPPGGLLPGAGTGVAAGVAGDSRLAPRPKPGFGRASYDRRRPAMVVLAGPPGRCLDEVALTLVRTGIPHTRLQADSPIQEDLWARLHHGPLTVVLADPRPADWRLPARLDAPAVVVHSAEPDPRIAVDTVLRGAYALVWLDDVADDLCPLLTLVAHGYRALSAAYVGCLSEWISAVLAGGASEAPELTAREQDILASIARGHTVRQTAHLLGIATKTVENTQARLFRKLGTRNRSETLTAAYRLGLVEPLSPAGS